MSYSSFLLKSHENLHRNIGSVLSCLISLSTAKWGGYLLLLEQFQNEIVLLEFLLKKALRSWDTAMKCSWKRWLDKSKICFAAGIASVIIMICLTFRTWIAKLIPHLIERSSTLMEIIFIVWWIVLAMIFQPLHICKIEVVTLSFNNHILSAIVVIYLYLYLYIIIGQVHKLVVYILRPYIYKAMIIPLQNTFIWENV